MEALTPDEIADQLHDLYTGLGTLVDRYLKNGDNPNVRLQPYAKGYTGPTHFTIGIEGLITGPSAAFTLAVDELAPGAEYKNELLPDGRPGGWKVHLPFVKQRPVALKRRNQARVFGKGIIATTATTTTTPEWVALLWLLTLMVGGLLYYRVRTGSMY
jgi:hypothetical protein